MNFKDIYYRAAVSMTMLSTSAMAALAQASGGSSTTGDAAAPVEFLKNARSKAANSALNASSISTGGNNVVIVLSVIFAIAGFALAGFSGIKIYKASQDENSREDGGRSVIAFVVGCGVAITGIVVGTVTNYMTGTSS
ncbi:hypothetical protein mvi_64620 (plasmid) [Methylobacterium indicum]|uniref:DUF4134 domain-containing protein n=2 Tax=Methylobacterium indicum TaxID=1775910 RepID=A0A8H8X0K4_9HYPH|nr:hypothetical protein mvi_64620 [Methylobacterium indicum]